MPNIAGSSEVVLSPFAPTRPEAGLGTRMRAKVSDDGFCVPRYLTVRPNGAAGAH